jgi:diadenosine tetraphosphate (Ap4A) HIT family hydrolase
MPDYEKFLIKDFNHWALYLHENQSYLGRCYLWCKRADALSLTDASQEEWDELRGLLYYTEMALDTMFKPDMLNFAFLGNVTRRLHGHIIPRYARSVEFGGLTFEDKRWGQNYQTDHAFITPPEVLETVIKKFKQTLA